MAPRIPSRRRREPIRNRRRGSQKEASETLLRPLPTARRREPAERFANVARLAARLTHELSNPLAAVKANIDWLATHAGDTRDAQAADVLVDTQASVARLAVIAADLRDLARVAPGEVAVRDVSRIVAEAARGLDHDVRKDLRIRVQPRLRALVDRVPLVQCVRHLVLGGAPLALVAFEPPLICIGAVRDGAGIVIELCATENTTSVTHGAERSSDGGLLLPTATTAGLHLILADELARAAGGTLETLRSADGALRFRVRLRAAAASAGEA